MAGADDERYEVELPARVTSVAAARHAVAEFGANHGADGEKIGLAVSEAVANAVVHAYPSEGAGAVRITARADDDAVKVVVVDQGTGIRPHPHMPGHGWGLSLIGSVADSVAVASTGLGVQIAMTFSRH
jgi:anti-sigma regulatory factor (Ser/Thr protein kinase)